jgi:cytolysin (calcineurin-like family phosphatase)
MNALPGTPYPPALGGGGAVARPRAVLVAGDLTDHGLPGEWRQFAVLYGRDGTDGLLHYPVEECTGNHDWMLWLGLVGAEVRARHGGAVIRSWDWSDVHVACLDVYPTDEALAWLGRDLAACGRQRPVVLYFHYGLAGPLSDWWPAAQKQAFARVIEGYNVVGIFHGHFHSSGHYPWNAWDAYLVGSPRHSAHTFAVVHITDSAMTVAAWDWDRRAWAWWGRKAINGPAAEKEKETATASSER